MNPLERLKQYLGKASFSSESDRYSALECIAETERSKGWQPIATAPTNGKIIFVAWEPGDWCTGEAFFRDGKWFAAAVFYKLGFSAHPQIEFREHIVNPVLWMPRPDSPTTEPEGQA